VRQRHAELAGTAGRGSTCCTPEHASRIRCVALPVRGPGRVGTTGKAYGLNMTDEMLDLARRNAVEAVVTNVEFLKGQIEQIPRTDAGVDVSSPTAGSTCPPMRRRSSLRSRRPTPGRALRGQ
jgi:methyltransferase family protein